MFPNENPRASTNIEFFILRFNCFVEHSVYLETYKISMLIEKGRIIHGEQSRVSQDSLALFFQN